MGSKSYSYQYRIMIKFILHLVVTACSALILSEYILRGVHFSSLGSAVVFALLLAVLNATVKPILKIIGLPLSLVTLGAFSLVINAVVILVADALNDGMRVDGFVWAFVFSILLSLLTWVLQKILGMKD